MAMSAPRKVKISRSCFVISILKPDFFSFKRMLKISHNSLLLMQMMSSKFSEYSFIGSQPIFLNYLIRKFSKLRCRHCLHLTIPVWFLEKVSSKNEFHFISKIIYKYIYRGQHKLSCPKAEGILKSYKLHIILIYKKCSSSVITAPLPRLLLRSWLLFIIIMLIITIMIELTNFENTCCNNLMLILANN